MPLTRCWTSTKIDPTDWDGCVAGRERTERYTCHRGENNVECCSDRTRCTNDERRPRWKSIDVTQSDVVGGSTHFECCLTNLDIRMKIEAMQNIEDTRFRKDQFLEQQILTSPSPFDRSIGFTWIFSWHSRCPYMSIAVRKIDSIWLCRSSYGGCWKAISTCRDFKATLELVTSVSKVNSLSSVVNSSVKVGSRSKRRSMSMITRAFFEL